MDTTNQEFKTAELRISNKVLRRRGIVLDVAIFNGSSAQTAQALGPRERGKIKCMERVTTENNK